MKKYTPAHYEKVKAIQGKKFYCPKHRQFRWKSDGTCSDCKRLEKRMAYVVQWLKDHNKWPHEEEAA